MKLARNRCAFCNKSGHNRVTCPERHSRSAREIALMPKKPRKMSATESVRLTILDVQDDIDKKRAELREMEWLRDQLVKMFGVDIAMTEGWEL